MSEPDREPSLEADVATVRALVTPTRPDRRLDQPGDPVYEAVAALNRLSDDESWVDCPDHGRSPTDPFSAGSCIYCGGPGIDDGRPLG